MKVKSFILVTLVCAAQVSASGDYFRTQERAAISRSQQLTKRAEDEKRAGRSSLISGIMARAAETDAIHYRTEAFYADTRVRIQKEFKDPVVCFNQKFYEIHSSLRKERGPSFGLVAQYTHELQKVISDYRSFLKSVEVYKESSFFSVLEPIYEKNLRALEAIAADPLHKEGRFVHGECFYWLEVQEGPAA